MDGVHTANWTARVDERIDRIEIDAAESGWISIYVSLTAIRVRPATSTPRFPRLFIRGGRADTRGTPHEAHTRGPQPHRQGFQPPTIARGRRAHGQFMRRIPSAHSCTTLSYVGRRVSGFQPAEIRTGIRAFASPRFLPVRRVSSPRGTRGRTVFAIYPSITKERKIQRNKIFSFRPIENIPTCFRSYVTIIQRINFS